MKLKKKPEGKQKRILTNNSQRPNERTQDMALNHNITNIYITGKDMKKFSDFISFSSGICKEVPDYRLETLLLNAGFTKDEQRTIFWRIAVNPNIKEHISLTGEIDNITLSSDCLKITAESPYRECADAFTFIAAKLNFDVNIDYDSHLRKNKYTEANSICSNPEKYGEYYIDSSVYNYHIPKGMISADKLEGILRKCFRDETSSLNDLIEDYETDCDNRVTILKNQCVPLNPVVLPSKEEVDAFKKTRFYKSLIAMSSASDIPLTDQGSKESDKNEENGHDLEDI